LSDYLDEDAREELCKTIEEHMKNCKDCRLEVDTIKKTIVLYQAGDKVELPVRLKESLHAALAQEYASGQRETASFD
jgi:predicted anti-sigma-YlaC factor YlaD